VLAHLGQRETSDLDEAIANWDPARIPRTRVRAIGGV
jgi:hypothetical protein